MFGTLTERFQNQFSPVRGNKTFTEDNHKEHLELIAQLAELLNNNTIRDKLLLAKNSQELFEIIKWNYKSISEL